MKVYVCFEAFYGADIVLGSEQKAFFDKTKAKQYCKKRQAELDKGKIKTNNIDAIYWTLDII